MDDTFLGEIRLMAITYAPRGWALCQGQLLNIQQNSALYSLLGTRYGGNGTTTFALPNLSGRAAVGMGQGTGLTNYAQGNAVGTETVPLSIAQIPTHTHGTGTANVPVSAGSPTTGSPAGGFFAKVNPEAFGPGTANGPMAADLLNGQTAVTGNAVAHENRMPYLTLNYCIATQGIYPSRS